MMRRAATGLVRLTRGFRPLSQPPFRFASAASKTLSDLLGRELAEETAQQHQLPSPPSPWVMEQQPGKIEMAITNAQNNCKVLFSSYEAPPTENKPEHPDVDFVVFVDKPGCGTLTFHCVSDAEEQFLVTKVSFYKDSALAHGQTVDADWKRDELYEGPVYQELDHGLQEGFDKFLSELGIDSALCDFLRACALKKEQKEYENWLLNVKRFMDS